MGVEEGGSAYPSARTGGKLVLDDRGCLRIKASADASGEVPLWPSYYSLDTSDERVRVLDEEGRTVAEVGETMAAGGGSVSKAVLQQEGYMRERTRRELLERCPGAYWLVGEVIDAPQRN